MFELEFDEKNHIYRIDGIVVPGCTTVTSCIPGKSEWLPAWACKEMGLFLENNWLPNRGYSKDEIQLLIKAGKAAHRKKKEKAADHGTQAHALAENFIKTGLLPSPTEPPEVLNAFNLFLKWIEKNRIRWIHSEIVVGSKIHMFGGKFDAVAEVNGRIMLIDFKTSSGIYDEFFYQLAGYQIGYEEMGKAPPIQDRMVLWIPKTGDKFEARIVSTPLAQDQQVFLAALEMYRCLENSKRVVEELTKKSFPRTEEENEPLFSAEVIE